MPKQQKSSKTRTEKTIRAKRVQSMKRGPANPQGGRSPAGGNQKTRRTESIERGPVNLHVAVSLELASNRSIQFSYEGSDPRSKRHVRGNGDIDLREIDGAIERPVRLWFVLKNRELKVGRKTIRLSFATAHSFHVSARHAHPDLELLESVFSFFEEPQFFGHAAGGQSLEALTVVDRNNDGQIYKYTLRVVATDDTEAVWLEDDPIIQNSPPGGLK